MKSTSRPFAMALALMAVLFDSSCSGLQRYKASAAGWEKDIREFERLDSAESYPDDAVLFMGSSSIRLWSTIREDLEPYPVIQRGFGGAKLSDLAYYAERIVYPHECRAVAIFAANDITGMENDKTPEEVARLFRYIVATIRKRFPETPLFYIQITPTESRWKMWPRIQEGNLLIKKECAGLHKVYFIETESSFLDEKGYPRTELFMPDKLHLNRDGYTVWGNAIRKRLDSVLRE